MSKKKGICKYCGAKAEHACVKCATVIKIDERSGEVERQNNICFMHSVFINVTTNLELKGILKLGKLKEAILCQCVKKDEVKGCALPVIEAMKEGLKNAKRL